MGVKLPLLPKRHPLEDVRGRVQDGDDAEGWAAADKDAGCLRDGWRVTPRVGVVAVQLGTPCVMEPLKRLPAAVPLPTAGVGEDSLLAASTFCCRQSDCRFWITDDEGGCSGCCG